MTHTTDEHINHIKSWLKTGELKPDMLSESFTFSSPFWEKADRQAFLDRFLDPTEYLEKSASNIMHYTPMIACKSDCGRYFTLTFTYTTKNGTSVDEAIICEVKAELLEMMRSIYDLELTKLAHDL